MTETASARELDLEALELKKGSHSPDGEMCVMEAVAYVAGEPWSDQPQCASPVITAFMVRWNDDLDDEGRQRLKPLIPKLVGTRTTPADEEIRAWMVTDWMVRTHLPAWLRLGGMADQADAVASLPPLDSARSWATAKATVDQARSRAAAARAAAGAAARAAARDAAGAAARAAARAAAWAAAGAAAWAAARAAAGDAAGDAARAAAWAAARDAAWAAARDALRPTAEGLQASALELVEQLCAVGRPTT